MMLKCSSGFLSSCSSTSFSFVTNPSKNLSLIMLPYRGGSRGGAMVWLYPLPFQLCHQSSSWGLNLNKGKQSPPFLPFHSLLYAAPGIASGWDGELLSASAGLQWICTQSWTLTGRLSPPFCRLPLGVICQPGNRHREGKHALWPLLLLPQYRMSGAPEQPSWTRWELVSLLKQYPSVAGRRMGGMGREGMQRGKKGRR